MAKKGTGKTVKKDKSKNKEEKVEKGASFSWKNIVFLLILAAVGYVIIAGPFRRGLFFDHELMPMHMLIFALFGVWCAVKLFSREESFLKSRLDWSIFALFFFYFLSLFVAVEIRSALSEFLKVANYFAVYLLVFDLCRRADLFSFAEGENEGLSPGLFLILHILLISGAAVAVAGLGAAAGTWDIHGAYVGGRIHSPLQYPNTAAAYLTASFFLAVGLGCLQRRWFLRPIYIVPASLILITFVFTFSRGAWLMMPFVAVFFLIVVGQGNRLRAFLYMLLSGIVFIPFLVGIEGAFQDEVSGLAWRHLIFSSFIGVVGALLVELFMRLNWKFKVGLVGAVFAATVIFGLQIFMPEIGGPLHLERGLDESSSNQYLEQRVSGITGGESYRLNLEVNAQQKEFDDEDDEPSYAWRLRVLGYDLDEESSTVLNHEEGPTDGWETREFDFEADEEMQRFEVRIYNRYPGTSVTARDVTLLEPRSTGSAEQNLNFTLHRMLPHRLYTRIFAIGAGERSVEVRASFYEDAFKIIRDYPLLGTGGGGWDALYMGYQEEDYNTTEVHSHFLQVWVESGTFGFAAFAGMWIFFVGASIKSLFRRKLSAVRKVCLAAILTAAVGLGAHSVIDFNLSLGAVSIFLFALLGAGRSLHIDDRSPEEETAGTKQQEKGGSKKQPPKKNKKGIKNKRETFYAALRGMRGVTVKYPWAVSVSGLIIAVVLFSYAYSLHSGHKAALRAAEEIEADRPQQAMEHFQNAVSRDPYEPSYRLSLADIYESAAGREEDGENTQILLSEALEHTHRAYELSPYDHNITLEYGARLMRLGRMEEGVSFTERAVELYPHNTNTYLHTAQAYVSAVEYHLHQGEEDEAEDYLEKTLSLEEQMTEIHEDKHLSYYLGRIAFLVGDLEGAAEYFSAVEEGDDDYGRSAAHLAFIYEHLGEEELAREKKEVIEEDEELEGLYEELSEQG